ncbi:MAG: YaiI/YqxD family protein [Desulfobacteraceae bacterium]|nr:YaiI/YqxD family protein [Desulfobacteraceae bacterium]
MQILVDADALPNVIKDILFRAVKRLRIPLTMVANQYVTVEKSKYIKSIVVSSGPDVADDRIVELVQQGDLVVTADIPLADRVVAKGAYALDPRGDLYTEENIKDRLAMRNLMNELRNGGVIEGGPQGFSRKDRQALANQLDRFLTKHRKG